MKDMIHDQHGSGCGCGAGYLKKSNYLGEFATETDKALARENLGIRLAELSPSFINLKGMPIDNPALVSAIENTRTVVQSNPSGGILASVRTVRDGETDLHYRVYTPSLSIVHDATMSGLGTSADVLGVEKVPHFVWFGAGTAPGGGYSGEVARFDGSSESGVIIRGSGSVVVTGGTEIGPGGDSVGVITISTDGAGSGLPTFNGYDLSGYDAVRLVGVGGTVVSAAQGATQGVLDFNITSKGLSLGDGHGPLTLGVDGNNYVLGFDSSVLPSYSFIGGDGIRVTNDGGEVTITGIPVMRFEVTSIVNSQSESMSQNYAKLHPGETRPFAVTGGVARDGLTINLVNGLERVSYTHSPETDHMEVGTVTIGIKSDLLSDIEGVIDGFYGNSTSNISDFAFKGGSYEFGSSATSHVLYCEKDDGHLVPNYYDDNVGNRYPRMPKMDEGVDGYSSYKLSNVIDVDLTESGVLPDIIYIDSTTGLSECELVDSSLDFDGNIIISGIRFIVPSGVTFRGSHNVKIINRSSSLDVMVMSDPGNALAAYQRFGDGHGQTGTYVAIPFGCASFSSSGAEMSDSKYILHHGCGVNALIDFGSSDQDYYRLYMM